ncbi:hypothetical protein GCM10010195_54120 [Kitasatospora griseola]|nr:hypothetical protein GCM10010195_54120 [Kitasatospora griseola]
MVPFTPHFGRHSSRASITDQMIYRTRARRADAGAGTGLGPLFRSRGMSRPGSKIPPLSVTDAQRAVLHGWLRRRTTAQALAQRSRIVLECAEGHSITEVSRRLRVAPDPVRTRRRRFIERGLDGLCDDPRPGAPRKITDGNVERGILRPGSVGRPASGLLAIGPAGSGGGHVLDPTAARRAAPAGTRGEESAAGAQYSFFTAVFRVFFHGITGGSPQ